MRLVYDGEASVGAMHTLMLRVYATFLPKRASAPTEWEAMRVALRSAGKTKLAERMYDLDARHAVESRWCPITNAKAPF